MSAAARFRYTLVAGATAVVIGTGFTVVGLSRHVDAQTQVPRSADAPLVAVSTAVEVTPAESVSTSPPASASPSPSTTTKSPAVRRTSRPARTATKSAEPTVTIADTDGSIVGQVLAHINAARTAAGLSALTLDAQLSKASALHNQLMINGCGLQHECTGEKGIGDRFSAQGVRWTSAGENIGYGSSGSSNAAIAGAANGLTDSMLAEKPPNDGHRKNLLNSGFKRIGLSVVRDSNGLTWMTQDFVN
jgi:uncharacterized protein YkwD